MEVDWFKKRQKLAGVTAQEIGDALGRDRSIVSRIYSGRTPMSLTHAKVFSKVLEVPLSEVISRAGVADEETARRIAPGFSEGDAAPWTPPDSAMGKRLLAAARELGADRPGIDVWHVDSDAMSLAGIMPGDMILVNAHAAQAVRQGDIVVAQVYDHAVGDAITVIRQLEPPALISATPDNAKWKPYIVDGSSVAIIGKVIASWRLLS